jgi:hypothetical protein
MKGGLDNEDRIIDLFSIIVEPGTYGNRAEWIHHLERTKATNAPGILFADALHHGLLVEGEPGLFVFVGRSDYE